MSVPLSDASPDATSGDVREWIARARRRLLCICAVYGASAALTLVALIRVLGWPFSVFVSSPNGDTASTAIMVAVATLSALGGAALAILATPRSRAAIAQIGRASCRERV